MKTLCIRWRFEQNNIFVKHIYVTQFKLFNLARERVIKILVNFQF